MIRLALVLTLLVAPAAQASRLVTYSRTGGIAGEDTTLKIERDRQLSLDSRQGHGERRISKARYKGLRDALRAAKFDTLEPSYGPDTIVTDGITETVRFQGITVATSTGGDPPKRLEQVLERLRSLAAPQ